MSYKEDIEINKHALDEEWLRQPSKYRKWSKRLAKAKEKRTQAKKNILLVRAKVSLEIRKNPTAYGIDKLTDKVVEALVSSDKRVIKAEAEETKYSYEADVMQSAVTALDHRKRALEDLVRLHLAGYFSQPHIDSASEETIDKRAVIKAERKKKRRG